MTKTSDSKSKAKKRTRGKKSVPPDIAVDRRNEWRFDLPLPATVEGKSFSEETLLENISSTGAYFCLDSVVTVGSKLNLVIEVPSELSPEKKIKLQLKGHTVRLEKPTKKEKKQGVAIRFNKKFKFVTEE